MGKRKIITIISVSLVLIILLPIIMLRIYLPSGLDHSNWPSECGTGFKLFYNDPTKHDASSIRESIRTSLAKYDSSKFFQVSNWWEYVKISNPDQYNSSTIEIPGAFTHGSDTYNDLVEALEEFGRIEGTGSWCI